MNSSSSSLVILCSLAVCLLAATPRTQAETPFRHLVLFEFKQNTTEHGYMEVIGSFMALKDEIDAIQTIEWGFTERVDPLGGKFSHAFLLTFKNEDGLANYETHPAHEAFKETVKKRVKSIAVIDYSVVE